VQGTGVQRHSERCLYYLSRFCNLFHAAVLIENLFIVSEIQLLEKFSPVYGHRRIIAMFTKARYYETIIISSIKVWARWATLGLSILIYVFLHFFCILVYNYKSSWGYDCHPSFLSVVSSVLRSSLSVNLKILRSIFL
jgi:hypothetical protein